jgi:hypothetical protein
MAKVKCYTPEGKEEMKEPVDAKECVESCGYTMEPQGGIPLEGTFLLRENETVLDPETSEEVKQNTAMDNTVDRKRGRKKNR